MYGLYLSMRRPFPLQLLKMSGVSWKKPSCCLPVPKPPGDPIKAFALLHLCSSGLLFFPEAASFHGPWYHPWVNPLTPRIASLVLLSSTSYKWTCILISPFPVLCLDKFQVLSDHLLRKIPKENCSLISTPQFVFSSIFLPDVSIWVPLCPNSNSFPSF